MGRPINRCRSQLSLSVPQETRELLETKSEQSKQTMSDLVDKLIRKAFGVKNGLAKQLEAKKAQVLLDLEQAEAVMAQARLAADTKLEEIDREWSGSMQAMLLKTCPPGDKPESWNSEDISRWLFDRRVIGSKARGENGRHYSYDKLAEGPKSFMASTMLPDKLMAADLAAEEELYELSAQAYDYVLSCYGNSPDAMYDAFNLPVNLPESRQFGAYLVEADKLFGTELATQVNGYGSTADLSHLPLPCYDPNDPIYRS